MSMKQKYGHVLIGYNIRKKYESSFIRSQNTCSLVSHHLINQIVKPKHFVNRFRINYDQIEISCNKKQFMKRYYYEHQYLNKITPLAQYYKYHKNYPCNLDSGIEVIMMIYQQAKNKQQRKFLKKLMNEQPSISQAFDNSSDNSPNKKNKQQININDSFSLKLKQIDSNRSSVMLGDICQQINTALFDIKPLYFYQGNYKDGVKQFKNFIMNHKNRHFPIKKTFTKKKLIGAQQKIEKPKLEIIRNQKFHLSKQNQPKPNKNQSLQKSKFQSSKQFRKTFHMNAYQNNKTFTKKQSISRLNRNKTVTIKPQSFSKTTANQTVSKDQYCQQLIVKKNNSLRFRKCKSSHKNIIQNIHKSKQNILIKQFQLNKQQKISNDFQKLQKKNNQIKKQLKISKSKKLLKKSQQKQPLSCLMRQQSKSKLPKINKTVKQLSKIQNFEKQNNLHNLIKTKLKLRA